VRGALHAATLVSEYMFPRHALRLSTEATEQMWLARPTLSWSASQARSLVACTEDTEEGHGTPGAWSSPVLLRSFVTAIMAGVIFVGLNYVVLHEW